MKNLKKIFILSFALMSFYSCSTDNPTDKDTLENYVNNQCPKNEGTCCGTSGRFKVIPGKNYTYSASTTIKNPIISWEAKSGMITLISSKGSSAVFKFDSNFTSGRISSKAVSSDTPELCETILEITKQ
jgi:hypothetical protein